MPKPLTWERAGRNQLPIMQQLDTIIHLLSKALEMKTDEIQGTKVNYVGNSRKS